MKKITAILLLLVGISACSKVPFTGRRQAKLLPESQLNTMALAQYKTFLGEHKLSTDAKQKEMVMNVGNRLKDAVTRYYAKKGLSKELAGYKWEFNLVDDPTVNAFCMPGGKVVVYTGIMPVCQTEDGLAVVMGHEIAHALAHHGNERMTQGLATQAGGVALAAAMKSKPAQTQAIFNQAYNVGTQVGALLPYSRMHESEADEIGLYLMAIAGYNPEAAQPFWDRMSKAGGSRPPEILSTHPDPGKRAQKLKELVPKAKAYAASYR